MLELLFPYLLPIALWLFVLSTWKFYIDSQKDSHCNLPLPPGTVGLPFIGESLEMIFQGWDFYKTRREKYGHIYKTHIMGKPTIRVWGTENIKKILRSEESLVTMGWPASTIELIGRGSIVNSTRKLHNTRRAMMSKLLNNTSLSSYGKAMYSIITQKVIGWCSQQHTLSGLKECREMAFEALNARSEMLSIIKDVIEKRIESEHHNDALSQLMRYVKEGTLSNYELEDGIIETLFSAYNGVTSMCCSAIVYLGKDLDIVSHLLQEFSNYNLLNSLEGSSETLSPNNISQIKYLDQVWKEIARIAPPFGGGFREVIKTFELEGYQIPAGWTVLYSIRDNHEAEENFSCSSEFYPDRWQATQTDDSFIVFGGNGLRSCIGRHYVVYFVKLFITSLVKNATWRLLKPDEGFTYFPVQLPKTGLPVVFQERKLF